MLRALRLTARQAFVLERLYLAHGWSVVRLTKVLGVGRRTIEAGLRRRGVHLGPGGPGVMFQITESAARSWFADAERGPSPRDQPVKVRRGLAIYRDRRCWLCGRRNVYRVRCHACRAVLAYPATLEELRDVHAR
jgi:hypothetical protein